MARPGFTAEVEVLQARELAQHAAGSFGIRMALGADAAAVLRMVIGQGMRLSVSGLAFGLVATVALSRVLASFLYDLDLEPYDPLTLGVVAVVLLGVSAIACLGVRPAARPPWIR